MEIVILILGVLFIFKDEVKSLIRKPKLQQTEEEKNKKKEYKEQFDKIMNYSYEQAISKRGDN